MHTPAIPRFMILAGALLAGVFLALAVTMVGQRFGLDLGALWSTRGAEVVPIAAALAWWITACGAFGGGYLAASFLSGTAAGELPPAVRYTAIGFGVLILAAAGQAASAPGKMTSASIVISGVAALVLGAAMSFCGAQLALRKD